MEILKRFLDLITDEAPKMIMFDLECNKCEFQRYEPIELIVMVSEDNSKPVIESIILASCRGFLVSFDIVYCYDRNRPNYHKLQMRSEFPSCVLSTLDLYKLGFTKGKQVIHLESIFKFTFRDKYNSTRKSIVIQIADKKHLERYNGKENGCWRLGTYQVEDRIWIDELSTLQFMINWIKLSLINGYVSRKLDFLYFEVQELVEEIDIKREEMLSEKFKDI
ncbi:hypothetical protein J2T12_000126 [Paenibacillus anaericanus]|uniref:hypothetical protein n=1 Tax=Paenibacillus anaericanus TaxID=170367 RepID=UPI00278044B3|nr:hypothetical protein [Paenibacillus anaericanus]MDQ0086732.1 hypothetical protein [Paenibacillus anaericanus]